MSKAVLKVGQTMVIANDERGTGLRGSPSLDSLRTHWLTTRVESKVKVLKISMHRRDLSRNDIWVQVECVSDPLKTGWMIFDPGGWDADMRVTVQSITLVSTKEHLAALTNVKCE